MNDYYESAEDLIITRARAVQELKSHGCVEIKLFFQEVGFFQNLSRASRLGLARLLN